MNIVILDGYTATQADLNWDGWQELGNLTVYDRTHRDELIERARDAEVILTNKVFLNEDLLGQLPRLKYIGILATGYNVVDLEAARRRGIIVTNIPAYSTMSVAQMALAHLLNITNHVDIHNQSVQQGQWQHAADFCFQLAPQIELWGQTLSIVGLGNTGQAMARLGQALGMRILAMSSKPAELLAQQGIQKADTMEQLFREADVLSLHCPLSADTHHLINADTLKWLKPSAILINTGRGALLDEQAVADALNTGRLYGCGVDVLEKEPPRNGSPLIGARNCYITPHIAWSTRQARRRLLDIAKNNLKAFLRGEPVNVVN
ncbi:MAG: D-2-hydroxyacid dehydrogenase [Bacteroidaceae bacterium]|nr:D-2-hydroxyacid dehydrogenase [Prevotellaceae bacterium]MDY5631881.1 D-2-hydroxyacid dehydrogenase [Bacteroidaceae bacterium]